MRRLEILASLSLVLILYANKHGVTIGKHSVAFMFHLTKATKFRSLILLIISQRLKSTECLTFSF